VRRAIAILLLFAAPTVARASTDPRLRKAIPRSPGTTTVAGEVHTVTRAPDGQIDGFVLENGVSVRLPPASGPRAAQLVAPGRELRVEGKIDHTGPSSYQIDADSVSDTMTGRTIFLSGPRNPPLW
jgi:hypothetical protein